MLKVTETKMAFKDTTLVLQHGSLLKDPTYGWVNRVLPSLGSSSPGSGVVIAPHYIVTTKHTYSIERGYALFGGISLDSPSEREVSFVEVISNDKYDLDLIKLEQPVGNDYRIRPMASSISEGEAFTLIAWGGMGQLMSGTFNLVDCSILAMQLGCSITEAEGQRCLRSDQGVVTEPGDSGGAVLNSSGELCGIITKRLCNQAGSFLDFTNNEISSWINEHVE